MLCGPVTAMAGFQVVDAPPAAPKSSPAQAIAERTAIASVQLSAVSQLPAASPISGAPIGLIATNYVGTPDNDIPVINGFGRDVKLADALKQIAPEGWHAYLKEEIVGRFDQARLVDGRGGRKWVQVLDILASDNGLLVDVDWARKNLYVGEKPPAVPKALPIEAAAPVQWVLTPGSSLRDTVGKWAKQAGWTVVWNVRDEQSQEDRDFTLHGGLKAEGDFTTAITKLFEALPNSADVRAELRADNEPPMLYVTRTGESK